MFGFKKKEKQSPEEQRAAELPMRKKFQYESMPVERVDNELDTDINAILAFKPANYYELKDEYLMLVIYYQEDYSEVFIQFEERVDDVCRKKSKMRSIDKYLMRDILRKFGVHIKVD